MDYLKINTIAESDFDSIVADAGGTRIPGDGSADYLFYEAVVELKRVEEEGFEKLTRQEKIAQLFRDQQGDASVVVIDPSSLDFVSAQKYYNIVAGPIQTHVKKAARQLERTRCHYPHTTVSTLVILNNGYSALSSDEFKSVCLKCVRNDTSKIDWVIVGGIYYYSDTFDRYVIAPFEAIPINIPAPFPNLARLEDAWGAFLNRLMTAHIRGEIPHTESKLPVIDLDYELDGIKYVKPAPRMGKSKFWPGVRPRKNSTGLTSCPHVATTLPVFSADDWFKFKTILSEEPFLCDTYGEWISWVRGEERNWKDKLMPLVPIDVGYRAFQDWYKKPSYDWTLSDLFEFANESFETRVHDLIDRVSNKDTLSIAVPEHIHLLVKEIGQDKANDLCSIYYTLEMPGIERRDALIENERLFFEYGVALAASYAVKLNVGIVLYTRDTTYAWT